MSDDIKKILARLDEALTPTSVKKGLNPQQRSVPQLPADFQPRKIRALGAATDPQHPMTGLAVGAAESRMPTPAKPRNPVAKNAPRSGAGAHANKKRADRYGEVKHKKSAAADDEIKEMQHRPEQAVMILRRIPEGYRGARLYEKIMNTIIKRLGPAGSTAERREFYQTLAADVMERYIQKYPAGAEVREDRAQDVKMSDAIDTMINGLETAKVYAMVPGGQDRSRQSRAVELLDDIRQQFLDTFRGRERAQWLDDFLTPLDWCADTLSSGAWNPEAMTQTLDICIALLDEMNDRIWREIIPAKDDEEGGISVGDLTEGLISYSQFEEIAKELLDAERAIRDGNAALAARCLEKTDRVQQQTLDSNEIHEHLKNLAEQLRSDGMPERAPFLDEINYIRDMLLRTAVKRAEDEEGGISVGDLSEDYNDEDDEEDEESNDVGFFVVIGSEDDGVFIGYVTKEDGRWYEQRVSGQPPYAWGGPKYMGYLTPRDVMSWIRRDYERHHEVKGPFADEESAREYAEQYLGEGVAEGRFDEPLSGWHIVYRKSGNPVHATPSFETREQAQKYLMTRMFANHQDYKVVHTSGVGVSEGRVIESGETYVWTAHFGDGSTQQLRIATDEVPYARAAFEKKFPNKELVKVDTDWKPQDDGYSAMPAARYTEPRPQPDNPMAQGLAEQSLAEAIAEIEEDMLSKVRNDLTRYLDRLEKKVNKDRALRPKDDKTMDEDPTAVDTMSVPPPAPIQDPVMPESVAVKSIALEDGSVLEIHGDQLRGFEVRRGGRSLATRFPNLDHAQMAVDLYRRRRGADDPSADYVEER